MAPVGLPVLTETAEHQAQDPRGQIGTPLPFGQHQETAVVDDPTQAPGALPRSPADPLLPALEMEGRGAERALAR